MSYEEIIKELKNQEYKPIYFLMGEEPYYIDKITGYIAEHVVAESEKNFNQTILYGNDTDIATVINTAKRFPMMASHQVVIVKEAQDLNNIDDLIYYAENPLKSTILVLNYKYRNLDKRKKLYHVISEKGILFESKRLYEDKIPDWIHDYLIHKNISIDMKACSLLIDYLGNDLSKLSNELDKLIISLPEDADSISADHIEKYIGISKDYNNFELHKALAKRNILKAYRIINYFAKNQKTIHISLTISSLYFFFSKVLTYHFIKDKDRRNAASILKVNPYFVTDYELAAKSYTLTKLVNIISLLREYDLKSKGYGNVTTTAGELLKELIYKVLH